MADPKKYTIVRGFSTQDAVFKTAGVYTETDLVNALADGDKAVVGQERLKSLVARGKVVAGEPKAKAPAAPV